MVSNTLASLSTQAHSCHSPKATEANPEIHQALLVCRAPQAQGSLHILEAVTWPQTQPHPRELS